MSNNTTNMKNKLLLLALFTTTLLSAQQSEIKSTITTFFEGMYTADTVKIKSVCINGFILQSVSEGKNGGNLTTESAENFYKQVAAIPSHIKIEERLLGYDIRTDGAMAHAWTPYAFYINDKLSHKGVNSFTLYNENGNWKIIHIVDTRRK